MIMDRGLLGKQPAAVSKNSASSSGNYSSQIKVGALIFFGTASALALGYFLRDFLLWGNSSLLYSSLSALVFLVVLVLQPFFIDSREALTFAVLFETLAMTGNFVDKISWTFIIAFAVIFLTLLSGVSNGLKDLEESLKVRFWPIVRAVLPKGIVAVSIFISIFSVLHFQTEPSKFLISEETFSKVFSINTPLIQTIFPGIDPIMTMDQAVKVMTQNQLNRLPEFQSLPKKAQEQELKKQSNLLLGNLSQYFGAELNPRLSVSSAIFEALKKKFESLPDNIKTLVFVGVGVLIFLTIEALAWPLKVIIGFLAFLVYEILMTAKFAKITVETRSKEIITLD
ncbi:MAG: hypothetical protein AAB494_01775 [Patescibacteria group bacterium]